MLSATYDGDDLLLSTIEGRQKHKNWLRDPRVSALILDQDIYQGVDYSGDIGTNHVRVVVRVTPTRVHIR